MRIVLFTNGEFETPQARLKNIEWITTCFDRPLPKGISIQFFEPATTKLLPTDQIHVFGLERPENWHWLKKLGAKLIVSNFPFQTQKNIAQSTPNRSMHFLRSLLHSPYLDDYSYFQAADHFILFNGIEKQLSRFQIPEEKVTSIGIDKDNYLKISCRIYEQNFL